MPNGAPHHAESHSASRAVAPNFALALQAPAAAQEGAGPAEDVERHNQLTGYIRTIASNYDEVRPAVMHPHPCSPKNYADPAALHRPVTVAALHSCAEVLSQLMLPGPASTGKCVEVW